MIQNSEQGFDVWPHDPTEIIREALRDFVGDGDGEDEKVLYSHDSRVKAEGAREALTGFVKWLEQAGENHPRFSGSTGMAMLYVERYRTDNYPEKPSQQENP